CWPGARSSWGRARPRSSTPGCRTGSPGRGSRRRCWSCSGRRVSESTCAPGPAVTAQETPDLTLIYVHTAQTPEISPGTVQQPTKTPSIAWLLWAVGVIAYVVAVLHRTSFGVAGLDAVHRFGASAGMLASFAVLQLLVYAGLQIPVGVLL